MSSFVPAEYLKIALLQAMKQEGICGRKDLWEKGVENHCREEKAAGKICF